MITFLLTDVEGSSRSWQRDAGAMRAALSVHDELVERAVAATGGVRPVEQGEGDSVVAAFAHASQAVACALELQRGRLRPRAGRVLDRGRRSTFFSGVALGENVGAPAQRP